MLFAAADGKDGIVANVVVPAAAAVVAVAIVVVVVVAVAVAVVVVVAGLLPLVHSSW